MHAYCQNKGVGLSIMAVVDHHNVTDCKGLVTKQCWSLIIMSMLELELEVGSIRFVICVSFETASQVYRKEIK